MYIGILNFKFKKSLFVKAISLALFMISIEAILESFADSTFVKPPQVYYIFTLSDISGIVYSFKRGRKSEKI